MLILFLSCRGHDCFLWSYYQVEALCRSQFLESLIKREIYWCIQNADFSSVQSLSHVWLFATPWTAARQPSLSITNSRSLLKLMSIESVVPSNHLIPSSPSSLAFSPSQHQGHFHWVSDAIQPSHPLLSPSPPAFNLSQHQGLYIISSSSPVGTKLPTPPPATRWRLITSGWAQDSLNTALLCHHQLVKKKICTRWEMIKTDAFPQMVNEN